MKRIYCSECGRKLIKGRERRKGRTRIIQFCPVHIDDMIPVTAKNPMVKEFRSYRGPGW